MPSNEPFEGPTRTGGPPTSSRSARSIFKRIRPARPLKPEHIKPRLSRTLGHVARPELHLRPPQSPDPRDGRQRDLLAGPGHAVPRSWPTSTLEGTYSEVYPDGRRRRRHAPALQAVLDAGGIRASQRADSRLDSRGGELGYVLVHAFGAAFDNPDLIAVAVVGDGEAETAPRRAAEGDAFPESGAGWSGAAILHLTATRSRADGARAEQ